MQPSFAHDDLSSAVQSRLSSHTGQSRDRFFVLKAKARSVIELSQSKGLWATRAHTHCADGSQPHQRLLAARGGGAGSVVLLFAENGEHAWVGYATMESDPEYEAAEEEFPYAFRVAWRARLPHAEGIPFGAVPCGDAHKVFNGDEVSSAQGEAIREAVDLKVQRLAQLEEAAQLALRSSGFVHVCPGETEVAVQGRLLREVEERLGPIVVACLCGSRRYNLHLPDSDRDLLVVYAARNPEVAPALIKSPCGVPPDYTVLEAGKFAQMLLEGDPRMVETVFLEEGLGTPDGSEAAGLDGEEERCVLRSGRPWASLLQLRRQLLCRALVQKYLGDATGRAGLPAVRKGAKREKHRKILYIAFRTLGNAMQACRGETLRVRRFANSEERGFIMSVRHGGGGTDAELLAKAEGLANEVRAALESSALAEAPPPEAVTAWLAEVRGWCSAEPAATGGPPA